MSKTYYGVVEDRNDPLFLGRCRVRIFDVNTPDKNALPTSDLSWTPVRMPVTSASTSGVGVSPTGLVTGTWVTLECLDGEDMQQFIITGTTLGFQNHNSTTVDFGSVNVDPNEPQSNPAPQPAPQVPAPTPTPLQPNTTNWTLGQTSAQYESGGKGPGTISSRISNDPGGESYGTYQFASYLPLTMANGKPRKGYQGSALQSYLATSKWSSRFTGMSPATDEFDAAWKQIASESSTDFQNEQHAYIQANFYNVMLNRLKRGGLDLTGFGPGVQDLVWSTAVQFGPGKTSIFTTPLNGQTGLTDVSIVTQVSDYKISTYSTYATRYTSEKAALLALCNGAVVPTSAAEANTVTSATPYNPSSPENYTALQGSQVGYSDPNNVYPLPAYDNLPDTNPLAYGSTTGTQAEDKQNNRTIGIPLPNGATFDQPNSPYNAQYPYNKVISTESGHVIEIDDTPGFERINIYHKSGSFLELDAIGNSVRRVVGSDFQFTDDNSYIAIDGRMNVSVGGSVNVYIGADANIQVNGNTTLNCGNNIQANAGGRLSLTSAVAIDLQAPYIYATADNDVNILAEGGDLNMQANGQASMLASGIASIDGATVSLDSGDSQSAEASQGVEMSGAIDYTESIIQDHFPQVVLKMAMQVEAPEDSASVDQLHANMIASGLVTADQLAQPGIASTVDTTPNPPANNTSPVDCVYINTLNGIPNNFRLSPNYLLSDLSTNTLVSHYQVQAQVGLSVNQIVCNLYQLATNVLEPIRQKWPNVQINSAFRTAGSSISTSQHPKGMAVDISFPGFTNVDYMNRIVEIKQLLAGSYDQLILESLAGGHNWIHCSYSAGSNRGQCFTMYNNKTYAQGFVLVN